MGLFKGLKTSGVTGETPKNLMLGAGTYYSNLNYNKETDTWTGEILAATSGGGKFSYVPSVLNIDVDGANVKVKGLTVKVGEEASIEANVIEVKPGIIKAAIIGKDSPSEVDGFRLIEPKANIENSDYLDNIAFVGFLATNEPIIIIMGNALCISGFELSGKNKENAQIPIKFESHADFDENTDHSVLPVKIYMPETRQAEQAVVNAANVTANNIFDEDEV